MGFERFNNAIAIITGQRVRMNQIWSTKNYILDYKIFMRGAAQRRYDPKFHAPPSAPFEPLSIRYADGSVR